MIVRIALLVEVVFAPYLYRIEPHLTGTGLEQTLVDVGARLGGTAIRINRNRVGIDRVDLQVGGGSAIKTTQHTGKKCGEDRGCGIARIGTVGRVGLAPNSEHMAFCVKSHLGFCHQVPSVGIHHKRFTAGCAPAYRTPQQLGGGEDYPGFWIKVRLDPKSTADIGGNHPHAMDWGVHDMFR